MDFYKKYNPITATPFACNDSYMEFVPCDALKPFIRCFWGTHRPLFQKKTQIQTTGIVTPDTCMDIMFDVSSIYELIPQVEKILMESYNSKRENAQVFQAVAGMLESRGKQSVSIITAKTYMSERQLERLFREYVGVTPKKLAAMIRYQYLWNDIAFQKHFDIRDAVYQYGYSDQAHLCHEFKKYHSMNIADAKKYAFLNVGKVQEANDNL